MFKGLRKLSHRLVPGAVVVLLSLSVTAFALVGPDATINTASQRSASTSGQSGETIDQSKQLVQSARTDNNTSTSGGNLGSSGNSEAPSSSVLSVPGPSLVLSDSSLVLPKLSATSNGWAYLTIKASIGDITQPIASNYKKVVALETSGTPPSDEIFRTQWHYKIERIDNALYGPDSIDFRAKTRDGKVLKAHVDVKVEPIPSFTVTKGALDRTTNTDGTVTYTARFTLNPGPHFGHPKLNMCIMAYSGGRNYCDLSKEFIYSGNNNLSMSKTITPFSSGTFSITVHISGWYTNGSATMSWHDDY